MEKEKFMFPLNLQYFADDEDKEEKNNEELDDADFEDEKDEKDSENQHEDDKDSNQSTKKKQSQEENARQAKLRREKEQKEKEAREERIRKEAYEKGKLDATKINPFTNKPIEDNYDLKIYELQKKIEESGGHPIDDLPTELAKLEREEAKKKKVAEEEKAKEDQKILNDISDFKTKYKNVNVKELLSNPLFDKFSNGKLGNGKDSLIKVYEDFLEFTKLVSSSKEEEEKQKKADEEAKKKGIAPSPNGGKTKDEKSSYSKLSEEERIKELKKQGLIR